MKRALAIFRKDVRRLWPIALVLPALLMLAGVLDPAYTSHHPSQYLQMALAVACWIIVISAIHQERLPGDRQYWLTRPFTWKHVLAAKILFVFAFVNLPVLVYYATVWTAMGIPPLQHLPVLLWKQMFFTAMYILPAAALAAITKNLGETIMAALLAGVPWIVAMTALHWPIWMIAWYREFDLAMVTAAGCGLALLLQYWRRRTGLARALAACTLAALLVVEFRAPRSRVFARRFDESPVRMARDMRRPPVWRWAGLHGLTLEIPIRLEGVPAGVDLFTDGVTSAINGPGFASNTQYRGALTPELLRIDLSAATFRAAEEHTLDAHGTVQMTLFRRRQKTPAPTTGRMVVPGMGICSPRLWEAKYEIACYTPLPRLALFAESGPIGPAPTNPGE